jgi:hypothetical protein
MSEPRPDKPQAESGIRMSEPRPEKPQAEDAKASG